MPSGPVAAALAYLLWGLFPLYFKQVAAAHPLEVVLHRAVWALVFLLVLLAAMRRLSGVFAALRQPRVVALFALSALLLSANWMLYVWAVVNDHVIDASLGYFINPLVSVMLGALVLHERLRRAQWLAVGLAAGGVLWLTLVAGQLPWIGLVLALSFGVYGLIRKTAPLGTLDGLTLETLLLAPLSVPLLAAWTWTGTSAFVQGDAALRLWLILGGPLTAVALLLFAAGARRVTLTTLGLIQYISPTLQFALGVWLYREPFETSRLVGFACIWAALAFYSAESLWFAHRRLAAAQS